MPFKIDLHLHSRYSGDSDSDPENTVLHAIRKGLHGIAFTEHYSYEASEFAEGLREKYGGKILIFRGVEFSSAEGHCLVFGSNTDRLAPRNAPVEELVRIVNESGGVVIPSHPFRGINSLGERILKVKGFHAVEGVNGYNLRAYNEVAVKAAKALNLPYTGGSDAHESHEVGACYTEFRDKVTYENFLDLLRAGNYAGVDTRKVSRGWTGKSLGSREE